MVFSSLENFVYPRRFSAALCADESDGDGDENGPKMAHLESNFLRSLQKMYPMEERCPFPSFPPPLFSSLFHRDENDKKEEEKFAPDFSAF